MLSTAVITPLPPNQLFLYLTEFWSLNSKASLVPVEAPEGTIAEPKPPISEITSTWTVGLPRESKISLAWISIIADIYFLLNYQIYVLTYF